MSVYEIAATAHEANRAYCAILGDHSQVPWGIAPQWQRDSAVAGVKAVQSGSAKTAAQTHAAWVDDKERAGWTYGETKDVSAKTHPCMVPYQDMTPDQQRKDTLFRAIVFALGVIEL